MTDEASAEAAWSTLKPGDFLGPRVPGVNTDKIDVDAGLDALTSLGFTERRTVIVINYALNLWRRGEEEQADKNATDSLFHGIDFVSWRRVLAAARAAGEAQ